MTNTMGTATTSITVILIMIIIFFILSVCVFYIKDNNDHMRYTVNLREFPRRTGTPSYRDYLLIYFLGERPGTRNPAGSRAALNERTKPLPREPPRTRLSRSLGSGYSQTFWTFTHDLPIQTPRVHKRNAKQR